MAKKLISLVNATLIDALVKDEAAINSTTESNVIENHLLDSFLPRNEQARFMSESYLYGDNQGIGPTLKQFLTSTLLALVEPGQANMIISYQSLNLHSMNSVIVILSQVEKKKNFLISVYNWMQFVKHLRI